jgi:hypothetical protein
MSHALDIALVAIVILASVGYAVFTLGPKSFRRGIANRLIGVAARSEHVPGWRRFTRRLSAGANAKLAGGSCGGCDNCGSETAAKPTTSSVGAGGAGGAAEVRIPVAQIRRRVQGDAAGEAR